MFLSSVMTRFHQQLFEHYEYLMIIKVSRPQSEVITSLWISVGTLVEERFLRIVAETMLQVIANANSEAY